VPFTARPGDAMSRTVFSPREAYAHFEPIETRWGDNDVYGHVNNVAYYAFFDTVVNRWLIENDLLDLKTSSNIFLVVETGCAYAREVSFPASLQIGIGITRLGTSSMQYQLGVFAQGRSEAAAQGRFVHVLVEKATRRPVPIAGALRTCLERLLLT
jgi:acyl-CoA thioester hydrolase